MGLLKMGGKAPDGKAKAVGVDENGNLNVKRHWGADVFVALPKTEFRDTNAATTVANPVDVRGYGFVSLRVSNTTDAAFKIMFYDDYEAGDMWVKRLDGSQLAVIVPVGDMVIITPEDIPEMNYMQFIKLRVTPQAAPTKGSFRVDVIAKR